MFLLRKHFDKMKFIINYIYYILYSVTEISVFWQKHFVKLNWNVAADKTAELLPWLKMSWKSQDDKPARCIGMSLSLSLWLLATRKKTNIQNPCSQLMKSHWVAKLSFLVQMATQSTSCNWAQYRAIVSRAGQLRFVLSLPKKNRKCPAWPLVNRDGETGLKMSNVKDAFSILLLLLLNKIKIKMNLYFMFFIILNVDYIECTVCVLS